jgi:hypothetical protein
LQKNPPQARAADGASKPPAQTNIAARAASFERMATCGASVGPA